MRGSIWIEIAPPLGVMLSLFAPIALQSTLPVDDSIVLYHIATYGVITCFAVGFFTLLVLDLFQEPDNAKNRDTAR